MEMKCWAGHEVVLFGCSSPNPPGGKTRCVAGESEEQVLGLRVAAGRHETSHGVELDCPAHPCNWQVLLLRSI